MWVWKKPAAVPFNRKVNPVSGCEFIVFGIKPGATATFNADAELLSLVERHAFADKVSSIVYRLIKNSTQYDLDDIFKKARAETEKLLSSRKSSGNIIHCVIPNTLIHSGGNSKDKIHPTQKPIEILRFFIELLTKKNDLVLDTFAGSGSTGAAAAHSQRHCILIEKDPAMFTKMQKSIEKLAPIEDFFT